ncbi:hypothetical protein JOQ06_029151 [Pogonophryne albipinna]|uniref:Uncharacterized protein n=1 Tax=Pogonophryne albipinna TaxID=1090488 RepID=A0AAD6BBH7_9TELE|nr:hypothetical protein JOQ06_029146 [Pogonophryne albipinna]KAJ4939713.1 hypothetical protein JOQ06_029151 [Pogonophryne albipinna]
MFLSGNKKITVKLRDNTVDLKETKDLFARLMVLARSNRDINQKEAIGNYEFTLKPRALFASNGTDLTDYLAAKILEYKRRSSKLIITSVSGNTRSNKYLLFEENNHEEADTLLIHQAVLASHRNPADAQLMFFSPDTDILVLVTANYDLLLKNTSISMASGVVQIEPLWRALGKERAKALPAFYTFTGADNTGRFSRIRKATWLQIYLKADEDIINALQMLLDEAEVAEGMLSTLASFVCAAYSPKGINIKTIPELRWYIFCKHRAESDKLSPTLGALKQHILRVHVQTRIWAQAAIALQDPQPDPLHNGYFRDSDGMKPTTTEVLSAPKQCQNDDDSHAVMDESVDDDSDADA